MSFYSRWQPLLDEDRHTALVFGFLRHAPVGLALVPWLERVLDRPVTAEPLAASSFWPTLPSVVAGSEWTEPELVFDADDGQPLKVIVEVKPGYEMHELSQIAREVVDVAASSGGARAAMVMVGADLGRPASTDGWDGEVAAAAMAAGLTLETEVHYSSFALLGQVIRSAGMAHPEWHTYATDVLAQLQRKGLLGYEGAPMLDDLEGLTRRNAVEVFNRITKAARQFFLQLHGQSSFATSGLQPELWSGNVTPRMIRDGRSDTLTAREEWFEARLFLSLYNHAALAEGERIFIGFDLVNGSSDEIEIVTGRFEGYPLSDSVYGVAEALAHEQPATGGDAHLPYEASYGKARFLYDRRPWIPGLPSEDIEWVLSRAAAAAHGATT